MNAAQSASSRDPGQHLANRNGVNLALAAHAQKFAGPYDFEINRHGTL